MKPMDLIGLVMLWALCLVSLGMLARIMWEIVMFGWRLL